MAREQTLVDYIDANGKPSRRWRNASASKTVYPTACMIVGTRKFTTVTPAARALARYLADRVARVLEQGSKPLNIGGGTTWAERNARYQRLYKRAFPLAKRYVMKYLR